MKRPDPPAPVGHEARWVDALHAKWDYVCPGCRGTIPARTGHVVVWRQELPDVRDHWHGHCWRSEAVDRR